MREKLPLHGRSHLSGGSDPIPGLGGSGIQFDTDPQEGGYLHVSTNSFDPSDTNFAGIGLYSTGGNPMVIGASDLGWVQILFEAGGVGTGATREIRITDTRILAYTERTQIDMFDGLSAGLSQIDFTSEDASMTLSDGAGLVVEIPSGTAFNVNTSVDAYFAVSDDGSDNGIVEVQCGSFSVNSRFPHTPYFIVDDAGDTATTVQVKDNAGNLIFQIDDDGDIHIKTGKTVTADL